MRNPVGWEKRRNVFPAMVTHSAISNRKCVIVESLIRDRAFGIHFKIFVFLKSSQIL